ncbi:MAG: DNA adenine methylase [Caldilineaceae bacterium]|nr:DNA adenine methylase [Caldilineaceae bacterium]
MPFYSPFRYPGGKRKLANFIKLIFIKNDLLDGDYIEPYAGGAGVALSLLFDEYVRRIYINDLDPSVYSFWHSVLNSTDHLCQLIHDTSVTIDEWQRQKQLQIESDVSHLELGFSTFFLNRTNRSGIISGGVIGGKKQIGNWKLDARYNKKDLIKRIERIARFRDRIHLFNLDASVFIDNVLPRIGKRSLSYFDPPYYVKGQQLLYTNFYGEREHESVAKQIQQLENLWIVSYDDAFEIRSLYADRRVLHYGLNYSAQDRYLGAEVMFFCDDLLIPEVTDPSKLKTKELTKYML